MIKEFNYIEQPNIEKMFRIIDAMAEVLEALDEGLIPNESDYTRDDLSCYLQSLVSGQRGSLGRTKPGSWAVAPDDSDMDSDARVDFIFIPTYLATATLSRAICEFPLITMAIPGYVKALLSGMTFCSYRKLQGSGFEGDPGAINAMRILSLGKIPWLLNRHPDACHELKQVIDDVANGMAQRLINGSATGMWGEDYSEGFRSALETLRLTNDDDFMASLEAARNDQVLLRKEELPW